MRQVRARRFPYRTQCSTYQALIFKRSNIIEVEKCKPVKAREQSSSTSAAETARQNNIKRRVKMRAEASEMSRKWAQEAAASAERKQIVAERRRLERELRCKPETPEQRYDSKPKEENEGKSLCRWYGDKLPHKRSSACGGGAIVRTCAPKPVQITGLAECPIRALIEDKQCQKVHHQPPATGHL